MGIEREQFEHEEAKAAFVLKNAYPQARMEWINYWLNRWWLRKRPLIEMLGDIRVSLNIGDITDEEDGTLIEDEKNKKRRMFNMLVDALVTNNLRWILMYKNDNILMSNINKALSKAGDIDGEIKDYFVDSSRDENYHIMRTGSPDWWLDIGYVNRKVYNELKQDVNTVSNGGNVQIIRAVSIDTVLNCIIYNTPLDCLKKSKMSTGMKISKFLRALYPDDTILVRIPHKLLENETDKELSLSLPRSFSAHETYDLDSFEAEHNATVKYRTVWDLFDIIWSRVIQKSIDDGNVVVSAAPVDYLMMSVANNWSSCHKLTDSLYSTGGPAYAVDPSTLIAYKPTSSLCEAYGVEFDNKEWRQVVHVDLENKSAVFGRHYPDSNDAFSKTARTIVNRSIADYYGLERTWVKKNGSGNMRGYSTYAYAESNSGVFTVNKNGGSSPSTYYGVRSLRCLGCGDRLWVHNTMLCSHHCCNLSEEELEEGVSQPRVTITPEGSRYYFDDGHPTDKLEEFKDLIEEDSDKDDDVGMDNCYWCGDEFCTEDMVYIEEYAVYVCSDCYDENYGCCSICGDIYSCDLLHDTGCAYVCRDCFEEHYVYCSNCNDVVHIDDAVYFQDTCTYYCSSCADVCGVQCAFCEIWFSDEETVYLEYSGEGLCDACYTNHAGMCEGCGEHFYDVDLVYTENGTVYCANCSDDNIFECDICGNIYDSNITQAERGFSIVLDDMTNVCGDCYAVMEKDDERRVI